MRGDSRRLLIAAIVSLAAAIVAIGFGVSFIAQDRCLDAGGAWDDAAGLCIVASTG